MKQNWDRNLLKIQIETKNLSIPPHTIVIPNKNGSLIGPLWRRSLTMVALTFQHGLTWLNPTAEKIAMCDPQVHNYHFLFSLLPYPIKEKFLKEEKRKEKRFFQYKKRK